MRAGRPLHFIALVDDVSSRKRYESQLQHMADHDPLTDAVQPRAPGSRRSTRTSRACGATAPSARC